MALVGGGDERLLAAFRKANERGLSELERKARARAGIRRDQFHPTANLTVSSFTHVLNRNGEPHVHDHKLIYNLTFDPEARDREGRVVGGWRALEPSALFAAQERVTAIHRADIAAAMHELGYEITVDDKGCPQIDGISKGSQAGCSTRSEEVRLAVARMRARAEGRGLVWDERLEGKAREWAAKQTRPAKPGQLDLDKVKAACRRICREHGDDIAEVVRRARRRASGRTAEEALAEAGRSRQAVRDALDLAILDRLERASVFSAEELEAHALTQHRYAGLFTVDDVRADVGRRLAEGLLLSGPGPHGQTLYTTKGVLTTEENAVVYVWQGRGKAKPLGSERQVGLLAALPDRNGNSLNDDQAKAFTFLALGPDQIIGLRGKGGAGKTFVFVKLSQLAALRQVTTRAFAPTLTAVETLQQAGLSAVTLQSFLLSKPVAPSAVPELWLLDESTMVGAADMEAFLRRAREANAKAVLAGDTRQYGSVPAGRSFEQLLRYGLPSAELSQVIRQDRSPMPVKRAVHLASEQATVEAIDELDQAGRVFASLDPEARVRKASELSTSLAGTTQVVCATNQERHEINRAVRAIRKGRGEVEAKGVRAEVYLSKHVSKAGRREAKHYEKGDVVRFTYARDKRLRRGVWYRVVGRDLANNTVTVKGPDGKRLTYSPEENPLIQDVFETRRREFSVGDKLELRGKDPALGLFAGESGTVVSLDKKGRVLTLKTRSGETKKVDLRAYKTLDYAYASTGHGTQSRTVANVVVLLTSGHREEVVNRASLYVGISRTKGDVYVVTDDLAEVSRQLSREHKKVTALDIVPSEKLGLGLSRKRSRDEE
jgi:conjugative relaxase-like TrwC/TraI family protein